MTLRWTKTEADWSTKGGPLSAKIQPKGDGRWNWQILRVGQPNPMAAGVANSLGAAKNVVEQFVNRSGLL